MGVPSHPCSPHSGGLQCTPEEGSQHTQREEGWRSWHRRFPHLPYLVQQGSAAARGHQGLNTRVPRSVPAAPASVGGQGFEPHSLPTVPSIPVFLCRPLGKPSSLLQSC